MISESQLRTEIEETKKDLDAFLAARDLIRTRLRAVVDEEVPRALPSIANWSGTDCVLGGLDLTVHALERTLEELKIEQERRATDRPLLRLVETNE